MALGKYLEDNIHMWRERMDVKLAQDPWNIPVNVIRAYNIQPPRIPDITDGSSICDEPGRYTPEKLTSLSEYERYNQFQYSKKWIAANDTDPFLAKPYGTWETYLEEKRSIENDRDPYLAKPYGTWKVQLIEENSTSETTIAASSADPVNKAVSVIPIDELLDGTGKVCCPGSIIVYKKKNTSKEIKLEPEKYLLHKEFLNHKQGDLVCYKGKFYLIVSIK